MIEPARWSDDPRAPDGAAMFRYLEPPPPMPAELRRATVPRSPTAKPPLPWIGIGLAAIVLGGLASAAIVAFEGREPDAELVDVRRLDPAPETAPRRVGAMQEALTPMADETPAPAPIVEEEREPKPRPRTTSIAPAVTLGQGQGYLHVNSRPWAEVTIDGRRVGNTPIVRIALAAGVHNVTLTAPTTGVRRTHRVQIRAGETSRLMVQLDPPSPLVTMRTY